LISQKRPQNEGRLAAQIRATKSEGRLSAFDFWAPDLGRKTAPVFGPCRFTDRPFASHDVAIRQYLMAWWVGWSVVAGFVPAVCLSRRSCERTPCWCIVCEKKGVGSSSFGSSIVRLPLSYGRLPGRA
jgi:hypothetical protein